MSNAPDLWVFGYGSLVWNPGIEVAETRRATLHGFRRRFCMWSIHHRGTQEEPGLVLALEPAVGSRCDGIALRAAEPVAAIQSLRERELVSSAYHEQRLELDTQDGLLGAVGYVMDTAHQQYVRDLTLEQQAAIISRAHGDRGPNIEYLLNTAKGLQDLGIEDPDLQYLVARVQQIGAER
ncbi:MAG: gamma-glutamylcyclotransferase [Pseudomonadota bacterium]